MADILLSVGMQPASADTSAFIHDLKSIINSINKSDATEIKIKPIIDTAEIKGLKDQLKSIYDVVEQINSKNFNLSIFTDNSKSMAENLGVYQERIRAYVRNIQEVYSNIGLITKSSPIRAMGTDATKYITPALQAIEKYGDAVNKLESRLDKTSTTAGAARIASDAREMLDAVTPLLELARSKNVLSWGPNDFKFPEAPASVTAGATNLKQNIDQLLDSAKSASGSLEKEAESVADSGQKYSTHAAAVKVAAEAEKLKAKNSEDLVQELEKEGDTLDDVTGKSQRHAAAYNAALTQVNTTLQKVQSAQRTLLKTDGGVNTDEYQQLINLQERLEGLQTAGTATPINILRAEMSAMKFELSGTLQSMNLFTSFTQDADNAQKALDGLVNKFDKLKAVSLVAGDSMKQIESAIAILRSDEATQEQKAQSYEVLSGALSVLRGEYTRLAEAERIEAQQTSQQAAAAKAEESRLNSVVHELTGYISQIGQIESKLTTLNVGDSSQFTTYQTQLDDIIEKYNRLFEANADALSSPVYMEKLAAAASKAASDVEDSYSKMDDAARKWVVSQQAAAAKAEDREAAKAQAEALKELEAAYKQLLSMPGKIASKKIDIEKLLNSGDTDKVQRLREELSQLESQFEELKNALSMDLSSGQLDDLNAKIEEANQKVANFNAAQQSTVQSFSDSLKSGEAGAALDDLIAKFDKLKDSSKISESMQQLKEAADIIKSDTATDEAKLNAYRIYLQLIDQVTAAVNRQANAEKNAESAETTRAKLLSDLEKQLSQVEEAQRKFSNEKFGNHAKEYEELVGLAEKLKTAIENVKTAEASDPSAFAQTKRDLDEIIAKRTELTRIFTGSQDGLSMIGSRLVYILSLSNLIMQAVRQIKKMVTTTIELDTAMTQLRVVTNAADSDYTAYGQAVTKTAKEIGASITDLIDSTTVFARLGYTLDESADLAKYTAMLSRVGDVDISSAQNALTAITKAFDGVDAENIEVAMDKMVAVGNNFPISVAQIAEGMNNAGSSLAAAGNTFEQSIALLTAANTTVQNISKASTGLRTITARIRGTKLELDDLGESIETAKYQEALDILTKYRVALTENGEYRATYDILKDLASVWNELSNMEQAAVAEQLAGKLLLLLPERAEMRA